MEKINANNYIRTVTLNNGGQYISSQSSAYDNSSSIMSLSTANQDSNSVFAMFTMEDVYGSVTDYLVKPIEVAYQETESAVGDTSYWGNVAPNDAYGTPNEGTWNTNNYGDSSAMATNDSYVDWANDYLWLPSMAETGWCDEHNGIWRTHTNQRGNDSSYTWLRSGDVNIGNNAYDLVPEGNNYFYGVVDTSRAVRPAIHLNLNEAARNSSSLTEETVWNGLFSEQPSLQDSSQANSESNPYIIDTASKLAYLSKNSGWASNKYFLQTVEINLNSEPWTPINNTGYSYTYYYDGGNHSISNLYVNTAEQELTSNNYIGLFGYVYGSSSSHAYIRNLNIDSGSIAGSRYIGAFVGYAGYLDVINCSNSGVDVNATSGDAGGIIGYNILGKIINCSNAASITSVTLNVRCFCASFG